MQRQQDEEQQESRQELYPDADASSFSANPAENEPLKQNFSLSLQQASSHESFRQPFLEHDEKELMEEIRSILYQENVNDEYLIFQLLEFFEHHKKAIHSQILRNTFALIMSLYGIHTLEDLKFCMHAAYGEGPSVSLQQKTTWAKKEVLSLGQQKISQEKRITKTEEVLKALVEHALDTAPFLKEEKDLALRYKIVTGFIGKTLGHMGQFKVDLVTGLIQLLFTELDEKTNRIFSSDIWFYANGTFKKKSM